MRRAWLVAMGMPVLLVTSASGQLGGGDDGFTPLDTLGPPPQYPYWVCVGAVSVLEGTTLSGVVFALRGDLPVHNATVIAEAAEGTSFDAEEDLDIPDFLKS